jgi:hypothetical protein
VQCSAEAGAAMVSEPEQASEYSVGEQRSVHVTVPPSGVSTWPFGPTIDPFGTSQLSNVGFGSQPSFVFPSKVSAAAGQQAFSAEHEAKNREPAIAIGTHRATSMGPRVIIVERKSA